MSRSCSGGVVAPGAGWLALSLLWQKSFELVFWMSLPRKAGSCRSLGGSDAAPDEDEAWRKMRLALQTLHRAAGDSGRLVQPEGMALDSLLVESLELCMWVGMLFGVPFPESLSWPPQLCEVPPLSHSPPCSPLVALPVLQWHSLLMCLFPPLNCELHRGTNHAVCPQPSTPSPGPCWHRVGIIRWMRENESVENPKLL